MSENFAELFEQSLNDLDMRPGSIIDAIVVDIDSEMVTVNAGLKSEGAIPRAQFLADDGSLKVEIGDIVQVALDAVEDGFGATRLSREKAKRHEAWQVLAKAHEASEIIHGVINGKVKGGFTVDVQSIRAFLPGSLVDTRPVRDVAHLEGKELEFKVIKLDQKRNNVVVSRRAVLEAENSAEREELLKNLNEGMSAKGVVKNLTDYGAFVDLGGVDGLLHITDMAWKRIKHPSEIVAVGDEIDVKVLKFDRERNRVSLGLKQLGEDPWVNIKGRYPENTRVSAKVTNLTDYGCFAEIEEGVEGLIHVSEMDWTNKNVHPSKVVNLGDEIEVMILDIDEERRRISLGLKQCQQNPWEQFAEKAAKGDKVSGSIKSITDFGVFIGLEGGIDGLIHLSDISWNETGEEAVRRYKKGEEVEAIILSIDPERERISLGVKQMEQDPVQDFLIAHEKGDVVKGKVVSVDARGAEVEVSPLVNAYLRVSEISQDRIEDASTVLKVGDEVEARLTNVNRKDRTLTISIKAMELADQREAMKSVNESTEAESTDFGPTSIGALIKQQMGGE
ncbi:30S ribosomal protein S1 [Litorivicinus lipolyticus]|uniref:30S ribosomal protein S1 n=1 Tax=Litorivicinus lipolyticus TaxID=418701 RepID=A0A5Q2QDI0_9GAMM|nr:30S ribosomal protein S1 [Litorivicinus lipolyticus]QGG80057.1 30S ribosomal protein S1 [Litorivicinus lipolyticus]